MPPFVSRGLRSRHLGVDARVKPAHDERGEFEPMQPTQNLQIDAQRLWDSLMHTAQIGGTAKGGICRLTPHRSRPPGARLVQGPMRGARLHGDGRRSRQHVRAAARASTLPCRPSPWARTSTPSRPAASSTACSASSARSKPCARCTTPATRPTRPSRSSTGPTRKARASRRPCSPPASSPACSRPTTPIRARIATAKLSARNSSASATRAAKKPAPTSSRPCSSCTSSKARSSRTKAA